MTAIESLIQTMTKVCESMDDLHGSNLIKKSIENHIILAKSHLKMEKTQLDAEYQRGYHDAQNLH